MKIRWLTRIINREEDSFTLSSSPILQYYDTEKEEWIDVKHYVEKQDYTVKEWGC